MCLDRQAADQPQEDALTLCLFHQPAHLVFQAGDVLSEVLRRPPAVENGCNCREEIGLHRLGVSLRRQASRGLQRLRVTGTWRIDYSTGIS